MLRLSELYSASDSDPIPIIGFLQELVITYGVPQPLHVLDIGCGPGRLLMPLARLRWQVTGMEPHPEFLAAAQAMAGSSRRVSVHAGGFLDLDQHENFDLVVAVNSSFAHLLRPSDRTEALRRIHNALRPGGVAFLDVPNFLWILKNYRAPEPYAFTTSGRPVILRRQHEIDYHAATFTTTDEYVLAESGTVEAQVIHVYGIATFPELEETFRDLGFTDLRTFSGYASQACEALTGPRMLLSARKPAA